MLSSKNELSEEDIYALLRRSIDNYKEQMGLGGELVVSPAKLRSAVKSWLVDKTRHCDFHKIVPARHKNAAWFLYWFIRLKPLTVLDCVKAQEPEYEMANELFAFMQTLRLLKISQDSISPGFIKRFLYMLCFRDITAKPMFMTLELLETAVKRAPNEPL